MGGKKEEAAVLQQLVVALLTGDLLVQGQAAAPPAVVQVETLLVSLHTESEQFVSDKVKYGVRSPKYIYLGSCAQMYSLAETLQLPPSHHVWAHIRGRYWPAKRDDISL